MSDTKRKARRHVHHKSCARHGGVRFGGDSWDGYDCGGTFVCATCKRVTGNCLGAADKCLDDCDSCAVPKLEAIDARSRARTAGAT